MELFYKQYAQEIDSYISIVEKSDSQNLETLFGDCDKCGALVPKVWGYGALNPKIMFVGLGPSSYDMDIGIPFSDKPGRKLQGLIDYLSKKINLENNVWFTNLTLCYQENTLWELDSITECKERFLKELKIVQPKNIIVLGEMTLQNLFRTNGIDEEPTRKKCHIYEIGGRLQSIFVTEDLQALFYKRDEVAPKVKEDLDFILETLVSDDEWADIKTSE